MASDAVRTFLARHFLSTLGGSTSGTWRRLLRENGYRVGWRQWPRAWLLTFTTLYTSLHLRREARILGDALEGVTVPPPLIILGHYRSGTTHLHNLLSQDSRFAFPTLFQSCYPLTYLSTEAKLAPGAGEFMMRRRPQDEMAVGVDLPTEDELALGVLTLFSPYLAWIFPRRKEHYDRYLTFQTVPEAEVSAWKAAFLFFMKKLTWTHKLPLILKSPPHTARIRLLLDLFPDARFVHIHRNPYDVFRSTKHLIRAVSPYFQLQQAKGLDSDDRVLAIYTTMYDAFFEQRELIPRGRFHEVRFEDLEREPLAQMEALYHSLGLPDFEDTRPALTTYLASIDGYRKNRHSELPEPVRRRVAREWERSFHAWGYDAGAGT